MSLGEKISALRKRKGISQELLADNSGVSLRTIQRIEAGVSIPRSYTLNVIAGVLETEVEELNSDEKSEIKLGENEADLGTLRLINLSALTVLLVPFCNIILPVLIWRKYKNRALVNETGRKMISFQILWTLVSVLVLVATRLLQVGLTGSVAIGHFPLFSIIYLLLISVNLFFIIRSAFQLRTDPSGIYSFVPNLF